jgi:hypothetical protein
MAAKHPLLQQAKDILHSFLGKIGASGIENVKPADIPVIVARSFEIAQMLKDRKIPKDIEAEALQYLHGLLSQQHVLNLTDDQVKDLIDKAISFAQQLHVHKE